MREIKFRVWHKIWKRMYEMDCAHYIDAPEYGDPIAWGNPDFEFMQFTGLKDKNGKEIWESDCLRVDWDKDKILLVKWDGKMAAFQTDNPKDPIDTDFFNWGRLGSINTKGVPTYHAGMIEGNVEVIGNIYENPELLKEAA